MRPANDHPWLKYRPKQRTEAEKQQALLETQILRVESDRHTDPQRFRSAEQKAREGRR